MSQMRPLIYKLCNVATNIEDMRQTIAYDLIEDKHSKHLDLIALKITEYRSPNSHILSMFLVAFGLGASIGNIVTAGTFLINNN